MEFPQREAGFSATRAGFTVVLKRNCPISPHGLLLVFALLAALGAWLIQDGHVLLDAPQARLEVGRHLDAASRAGFATESGKRLQS